jgi:hypothetical protein
MFFRMLTCRPTFLTCSISSLVQIRLKASVCKLKTKSCKTNKAAVEFVDQTTARTAGLIAQDGSSVKFGVDHQTTNPQDGRMSIRLESKKSYNQGLIVVDLAHMPGSICGTWPAFWTIGPDWPSNGEIDIIEGVNSQMANAMTLHTTAGCSINNAGKQRFTGSIKTKNCDTKAPGQGANVGCGISTTDMSTYVSLCGKNFLSILCLRNPVFSSMTARVTTHEANHNTRLYTAMQTRGHLRSQLG